ncbi:Retrovirus-related Pol poly from transposon 297 [Paramuricea clavata]|uniref:Retrovirus-related Pol poly from transposon 297 n=1 Tax=Paramuricea clavata TaxID=317549 RepID=A0A6S7GV01_PARCT|nr:Retrovirus-related Pol poly from transposon 297 [Paramuricea clavata]
MRAKRLIFGAKASQDFFDEAIYRIFSDIPRCLNQRDDILFGGKNAEEHDKALETVLQRAADFGVTFNPEKCQFGVSEIELYGHRFTQEGLKPSFEKVRAVKECKAPKSKEAVRSFLGMTSYLSKFIPRYSSLTAPLRKLTHKDVKFNWGPREDQAFVEIKESITSERTMVYINPDKPIVVRVEASYHEGLFAGLFQETDRGRGFISRTMTETEKRYSQTEKDALSVHWAKNRFSIYLFEPPRFELITAYKPLIPLFNKATIKLPPKTEKWVMGMQDVDFELIHQQGKDEADPLDFLSRHPLPETGRETVEKVVKQVGNAEHAVVIDQIQKEIRRDSQLQKLSERIRKGDWENYRRDPDIMPFYSVRLELYSVDDLIFRMSQIVIPTNLQRKVVKAAHHLGHLGITKTKRMLWEKYWFPTMNTMTKEKLKTMFATHGTSRQPESENGPPFLSKDFAEFAEEEGFHHHRVTPGRANGEAESFMKLLNKTEKIANLQGQNSTIAIQEMLTGFRSTPHPATGVSPYEAIMNKTLKT